MTSSSGAAVTDAYLLLGFHVPGLRHADGPALDLAATILGRRLGRGSALRVGHGLLALTVPASLVAYSLTDHSLKVRSTGNMSLRSCVGCSASKAVGA